MKTLHLLPILAAMAVLPCNAQSTNTPPPHPRPHGHGPEGRQHHIDRREAELEKRIDQGVAKGKLSTEQAAPLEGNLDQLKQDEAKALENDGKIGRREASQLNKEANNLSHEIHQAKHPQKH